MRIQIVSLGLGLTVVATLAGCPQPIVVPDAERRPDAAVEIVPPPSPACSFEPREVAPVPTASDGTPAAQLVRWRDGALLVRAAPTDDDAPPRILIERVGRSGTPEPSGQVAETGSGTGLAGLRATAAGEAVLIALTRPDGSVDLLRVGPDGASIAPPVHVQASAAGSPARAVLVGDTPLLEVGGRLLRTDGTAVPVEPVAQVPTGGDAGAPAAGIECSDGVRCLGLRLGGDAATTAADLAQQLTPTDGRGLGWLRRDESGYWLAYGSLSDEGRIATATEVFVARADGQEPVLTWAGDRFVVARREGADISRYVFAEPRRGEGAARTRLRLGGSIALPRPAVPVALTALDCDGPRHFGLAQSLGSRTVRFSNFALAGQVVDLPILVRTEGDVEHLDVVWDGRGYVLAWTEALVGTGSRIVLARFTCPDES